MNTIRVRAVAYASAAIVPFMALTAAPSAFATSSSAYGFEAGFTEQKTRTGLGPIAAVSGSAPPAFSRTADITNYQRTVAIEAGSGPIPSLFVTIPSVKTHAASAGIGVDSESAEGDVTVKGITVALMLNPPPPVATPAKSPIEPEPYLNISATKISSGASISQVFPQPAKTSTSAKFTGLVIFGSLVGNQTIKFTGNVPNNTVLFQSPTVTITANNQIIAGLISCTPKCVFSPVSVTGAALEISLTDAVIDGKKVSGTVTIGQSQAGSGGLITTPSAFASGR